MPLDTKKAVGLAAHDFEDFDKLQYGSVTGKLFLAPIYAAVGSQTTKFDSPQEQNIPLMQALDAVNRRYGRGALRPLSTGIVRGWKPRQEMLSPCYTTNLKDMMPVFTL